MILNLSTKGWFVPYDFHYAPNEALSQLYDIVENAGVAWVARLYRRMELQGPRDLGSITGNDGPWKFILEN